MTSIGALFFRSSHFPCIKRLEVYLWSCSTQIRRCCACPRVGLADLAHLGALSTVDSTGRCNRLAKSSAHATCVL
jgi:hypothetical protein